MLIQIYAKYPRYILLTWQLSQGDEIEKLSNKQVLLDGDLHKNIQTKITIFYIYHLKSSVCSIHFEIQFNTFPIYNSI